MKAAPSAAAPRRIGVSLLLMLAWFAAQAVTQPSDIYGRLAAVALAAIFAAALMMAPRLRQLLLPKWRDVAIGIGAGALMLAATYAGALVMLRLFPELDGIRRELYAFAAVNNPWRDRTLLLLIVIGEEALWRALLLDALRSRWAPLPAGALAVALYTVTQLGTGSWVVGLLALGCGTLWTALCLWRDSLWPPLLAHAMWTFALLVVAPI